MERARLDTVIKHAAVVSATDLHIATSGFAGEEFIAAGRLVFPTFVDVQFHLQRALAAVAGGSPARQPLGGLDGRLEAS